MPNENKTCGSSSFVDLDNALFIDFDNLVFDSPCLYLLLLLSDCSDFFHLFFFLFIRILTRILSRVLSFVFLKISVAKWWLLIVWLLLIIFFVIIIISFLGAVGLGIKLSILLSLSLLFCLNANCFVVAPVYDVKRVRRVLGIVLKDEDHLILAGDTLMHKKPWGLAFGGECLLSCQFFGFELRFGWLNFLGLFV